MNLDNFYDYKFNIAIGCRQISPGCAHCYAKEDQEGWGNLGLWEKDGPRKVLRPEYWEKPLAWHTMKGKVPGKTRPIVTCCSNSDVFEDHPILDAERKKLWNLIELTPWLDWHLVTKRADNVARHLPWGKDDPWPNVWVSASIENDVWAKRRLPHLANLNVVMRGAHVEPMLGPIPTLEQYIGQLDWVLVGGESRDNDPPAARKMQPDWPRQVKKICDAAGVPFFFKQWGSWKPVGVNADGSLVWVAKKRWEHRDGNVFLGKTWLGWPTPKTGAPR
jgi:protein gp37